MSDDARPLVTMISSYVPRKCGIATFANDLATALARDVYGAELSRAGPVTIVAMNDRRDEYDYDPEVTAEIYQPHRDEYRSAAEFLSNSRAEVINLQHEYGLFGGEEGEYLLELLDRLRKPLVSTLHTVLSDPSPKRLEVLRQVCLRSNVVVVMAKRACTLLTDVYGVPEDRIRLIHHGVPGHSLRRSGALQGAFLVCPGARRS